MCHFRQNVVCLLQRIKRKLVGEEVKGVGVIKDEEIKHEEIEVSHTLGGYRRCRYYSVVTVQSDTL
jgi:hypothetical protein